MLRYVADEERKEVIKKQIDEFDRELRLGIISPEDYEKEMNILMFEIQDIEKRQERLNG